MNEIKARSVPQIKGLRVEDFIYFIENETDNGVSTCQKITEKWFWIDNGW